MSFYLDTNAMMAASGGNAAYAPYLDDAVTGQVNLLEFHYHVSRFRGEAAATSEVRRWWRLALAPTEQDVLEASRLRTRAAKRELSFIDALGYAMARNRGFTFVTTDGGFRDLPGVKLVKAAR